MRYTRHELKQDKFAESAAEAVHEVVEHRSEIIRVVIALAVFAVLLGGAFWYVQAQEQAASDALGRAMVTYNAPVVPPNTPATAMLTFNSAQQRLMEAKKQLYAVSDNYGWTRSGQYAHYLAAICEQELGNDQLAEQQLLPVTKSHRSEVAALAKFALASVYRDENHDQDAINLLQNLIEKPTSSVPKASAQLALADLYLAEHQPDKAKVILEEVAKENPNTALSELAKSREVGPK